MIKIEQYLNIKYYELYVPPKHKTLKEELTNNKIYCIDIKSWNIEMEKAMDLIQTINAKQSLAETKTYKKYLQYDQRHPIHFGYTDNHNLILEVITKNGVK